MDHGEYLFNTTADVHGFTPDYSMIGDVITHTKDSRQYVITDFAFMGATDEWGFVHREIMFDGVTIIRPLKDLAGNRVTRDPAFPDGRPRFHESSMYQRFAVA